MFFIANTFFELELEGKTPSKLEDTFQIHPIFKQLQYLPFLFLDKAETVIVTEHPPKEYLETLKQFGVVELPQSIEYKNVPKDALITSWGASELISKWAQAKNLNYATPKMAVAAEVNSKLWNFGRAIKLPYAAAVSNEKELEKALEAAVNVWVAKTDQGFSGRGHCIFNFSEVPKALQFCTKEWSKGRSVIVEPWVERVLDFSSQWFLSPEGRIELLGMTKCLNTSTGIYKGTEVGDVFGPLSPFMHAHIDYCKNYLKGIVEKGYFGYLGIDAMIYKDQNQLKLHPIVEINSRMTMSCALLLFYKRHSSLPLMKFHFHSSPENAIGLLPRGFKRQLNVVS